MNYAAVVDTSTVIALARGGVFSYLGHVFQPVFIGNVAEQECQRNPHASAAMNQTQSQTPAFPVVEGLISRSRVYHPQLSFISVEISASPLCSGRAPSAYLWRLAYQRVHRRLRPLFRLAYRLAICYTFFQMALQKTPKTPKPNGYAPDRPLPRDAKTGKRGDAEPLE